MGGKKLMAAQDDETEMLSIQTADGGYGSRIYGIE